MDEPFVLLADSLAGLECRRHSASVRLPGGDQRLLRRCEVQLMLRKTALSDVPGCSTNSLGCDHLHLAVRLAPVASCRGCVAPGWSACAASSVPATGLSLRSTRDARDLFRDAGAFWCRLRRRCACARRETSCASRVGRWCGPLPARRLPSDRREAPTPPGPARSAVGQSDWQFFDAFAAAPAALG
jgi:hypothetical protein